MSASHSGGTWLDYRFALTFFDDYAAGRKHEEPYTLRSLAPRINSQTARSKDKLPWLKLARFGDAKTDKGSLRHNANVLSISGIEADHDKGSLTVADAVEKLEKAGVLAMVYTSPSHTEDAPRLRVLCPFSAEMAPDRRDAMLGRLNGLFGGAFAGESWTLSQSYYYGSVNHNPSHRVELVDGSPIDEHDELDAIWLGKPDEPDAKPNGNGVHTSSRHGLVADIFAVATALEAIPNTGDADWNRWNRRGMMLWAATAGSEAGRSLWHAWSGRHESYDRDAADERWDHYKDSPPTGIGAGSLFHEAKQSRPPPPVPSESDYGTSSVPESPPLKDAPRPLWHSDDEWSEATIPLRPWVAKGYALRGAVSLIAGAGSIGKSTLFKAWSVAAVLGVSFSRFVPTIPLRVLSYNVEDDKNEERRRFSATLRQFGATPRDLAGKLRIVGTDDVGVLIERDISTGKIRLTDKMMDLIQHIQEFKPDIVFLDPLVELHTSEENDNTGLRSVIAQLRTVAARFQVAVVLAHHVRKGVIAPGDPDGIRGAGSIVGAARVTFTVCGMSDEEADTLNIGREARRFYFRLDGAKMNYVPIEEVEWFERTAYRLDNGEDVASAVPWTPPRDILTTNMIESIVDAVKRGMGTDAYLLRSGSERSIANLCKDNGISTETGIRQIANAVRDAGFTEQPYHRQNRNAAKGLRAPDGAPHGVNWDNPLHEFAREAHETHYDT